jgi:hypothetical protein
MAPAEIIRQEDTGRGVSPATGDGTEQGPNEDENDVPSSPGTETQGVNEDELVAESSPGSETQGENEGETLEGDEDDDDDLGDGDGDGGVEVPPDGTEGEVEGDGSGESLPPIEGSEGDDEYPTPTTHADADEQAARLGITFPEETTKVVDKAEFIAEYRRQQAAGEPPADAPA